MNKMESLELKIATFLRVGVLISGLLMLGGWITQFKLNGNPFYVFDTYDYIPLKDFIKYHVFHKNYGVILSYAGLISLICLPVIRVILTAYLFIKQKEFALAIIALVVLFGLFMSMILGVYH